MILRKYIRLVLEGWEPDLAYLLQPPGTTTQIGEEAGKPKQDGISRFRSPQNSFRYVMYVNGEAVAALQVMKRERRDKWYGIIANVHTSRLSSSGICFGITGCRGERL